MKDRQGAGRTTTIRHNLPTRCSNSATRRGGIRAHLKLGWLAVSLFMAIFSYPALASGQATQGSLNGLVKDQQGLPAPGATVTVRNLQTNEQLTSTTNDQGVFELPSLSPGRYSVTVELKGFKKTEVRPVIVETARPSHIDVRLVVSQLTEEVTVKGSDAQSDVNVVSPEINTILTTRQLLDLPMIRNPFLIVNSLPGINAPSPSGLRGSSTNITQDGINVADHFNRFAFGVNTTVITDNTAEISISTNTIGATGGFGVAQIRVVTPSGANRPSGSVYWYHQNSALNANTFFNNRSGIGKAPNHVNSYGFAFGGPVYLPKLYNGKDRTFFFVSVDYRRQPSTTVANPTVLTQEAREGRFRYVGTDNVQREVNLLGVGAVSTLNPVTGQLLGKTPLPNNFDVGDGLNFGGFRFAVPSQNDTDRYTLRLDHKLGQKHQLEASYNMNTSFTGPFSILFPGLPAADQFTRRQMAVFALHSTLSSTMGNTSRFGFKIEPFSRRFGRAENFPFRIAFQGITNPENLTSGFFRDSPSKEFNDQFYWVRGNHTLNFGFESRRVSGRDINETGIIPQVNLGVTALNPSGIDASELPASSVAIRTRAEQVYVNLVGLIANASQTFNVNSPGSGLEAFTPFERRLKQNFVAIYGRDQWKVSPRFTATLGLRWEYHGVPEFTRGAGLAPVGGAGGLWGVSGEGNIFAPGRLTGQPTVLDFGGVEDAPRLYQRDWNNFAPSIGFAWDLMGNGRTSVRGGYSISYTPEALTLYLNMTDNNRGLQVTSTNSQVTGVVTATGAPITTPQFQVPVSQASLFALSNSANVAAFNPGFRTPYVQQWSIGVERALFAGLVAEARYVGNHGVKLTRGIDLNEVNIFENGFLEDFRRAAVNLSINRVNGVASFANLGRPGQVPLPLLDQIFGGTNTGFHRNSTFISNIDSNQVGLFANSIRLTPQNFPGLSALPANLFVVNPVANQALLIDNGSFSTYNALQIELRRRFSRGLFLSANYTFSKVLTDFEGSTTEISPLATIRDTQIDKRRASYDVTHVFNLNAIYELPFGQGRRFLAAAPGVVQRIVGGWNVSTIFRVSSGAPISVISGLGTFNQRTGSNTIFLSPDLPVEQLQSYFGIFKTPYGVLFVDPNAPFMKISLDSSGRLLSSQVDTTKLQSPGAGQLGGLPLGAFRTPLTWNADIAFAKRTKIRELVNLELKGEMFNAFNRPSFSIPGTLNTSSTQFGVITSAGSRSIQVSARINF
jgi:Carboxypeptidase regulatory-like domain/TonB dependent receptor-like, beta-barrel